MGDFLSQFSLANMKNGWVLELPLKYAQHLSKWGRSYGKNNISGTLISIYMILNRMHIFLGVNLGYSNLKESNSNPFDREYRNQENWVVCLSQVIKYTIMVKSINLDCLVFY